MWWNDSYTRMFCASPTNIPQRDGAPICGFRAALEPGRLVSYADSSGMTKKENGIAHRH